MLPEDHVIVLFGATGDLAKRKLLPGLFHLARSGLLPAHYRIIGSSPARVRDDRGRVPRRTPRTRSQEFGLAKPTGDGWDTLRARAHVRHRRSRRRAPTCSTRSQAAEKELGGNARRLYHLAIPPPAFASVIGMLGATRPRREHAA